MSDSDGIARWHYVKIYLEPSQQDELLNEHLRPLCSIVPPRRWFFVRYSDDGALVSGHHLRLRFQGPDDEWAALLALLVEAAGHVTHREPMVVPATYEPEVDRYGGAGGLAIAHQVFAEDSANVLRLFTMPQRSDLVWLASADDLLTALARGADTRRAAYERQSTWVLGRLCDSDQERERLLARTDAVLSEITPRLAAARHLLLRERPYQEAQRTLAELGAQLARAEQEGHLVRPVVEILVDLQHMHFNRAAMPPRKEWSAALLLAAAVRRGGPGDAALNSRALYVTRE